MSSHGGAGRPTKGQPRNSSEHLSGPISAGPHSGQPSFPSASSPIPGTQASLRLALALLFARGRQYVVVAPMTVGIFAFLLALRLGPFGLRGAWVSLLGLVVTALTCGAVILVRISHELLTSNKQFEFFAGRRASRRLLSSFAAAAVLPLAVAIVILPQRTNSAHADRAATTSDFAVARPGPSGRAMDVKPTIGAAGSPASSVRASGPAGAVTQAGNVQQESSGVGSGPQPTDWAQLESGRPWQPIFPWLEVVPLDVSEPGSRDPAHYAAVIDRFDVDTHRRYEYDHSNTYCNIFAWDVTKAMGVEIPHWYDENTGVETPLGEGTEMSANRMDAWFDAHGAAHGWREIPATEAANVAALGHPTLALWRNPNPSRSGHVALVRPESQPGDLVIAQAGAKNFSVGRYDSVFSNITPRFFTHD